MQYIYKAFVEDVHDGDTVTLTVDLGFYVKVRQLCRLAGINAIELKDPGGRQARDHLLGLLPVGFTAQIESIKPDKFAGRFDAIITGVRGINVNQQMIKDGYAAAWNGKGARPVPPWPRPNSV